MNALELTKKIVRIDTINPKSPERPCADARQAGSAEARRSSRDRLAALPVHALSPPWARLSARYARAAWAAHPRMSPSIARL